MMATGLELGLFLLYNSFPQLTVSVSGLSKEKMPLTHTSILLYIGIGTGGSGGARAPPVL